MSFVKYRQDPRAASRVLRGEAAIIPSNDKRLTILNETGTAVWSLCDGQGRTLDQICLELLKTYDGSPEVVRAETESLLGDLIELGVLFADDAG